MAVVVGGIMFLFLWPARTWLEQSKAMSAAQRREAVLAQENAVLRNRIDQLRSTAYVEQVARQQYGLVMPGEKAFGILPPAATTTVPQPPAGSTGHGKG
ncbi:MAG TPA: septum formation initiator family protein [Acidimicrobiales bacterium]|nr:septum formation initiator family protein [Acidimicrobiales bacterium]